MRGALAVMSLLMTGCLCGGGGMPPSPDAGPLPTHTGGTVLPPFDATTGCLLFSPASTRTQVLGHDGTYSVALSDGGSLWLFGDTFTGVWNADGTRHVTGSSRNASALVDPADLSTCFANAVYPGSPVQEVLVHPDGEDTSKVAAWTGDAVAIGEDLWLFDNISSVGPAGGLDLTALGAGVVQGQGSPPRFFRSSPDAFLWTGMEPLFGVAAIVDGDTVYVFGFRTRDDSGWKYRDVVVARVPAASIADGTKYEYFASGSWSSDVAQASVLFTGGVD
jgi:hypothetical protein